MVIATKLEALENTTMTRITLSGLALLASLAASTTAYAAIDPRARMDDTVVPGDNISLTFMLL